MISLKEIRSSYPINKREEDSGTWWGFRVMRPLSFPLSWVAIRFGLSANSISVATIIIGLAGCAFLCVGIDWYMIIGAVLLNIRNILDHVDGTIARATNTASKFGEYLDNICDELMGVTTPLSIGIGLYVGGNTLLGIFHPASYLIMGAIYGAASIYGAYIIVLIKHIFNVSNLAVYRPKKEDGLTLWSLVYKVGVNLQSLSTPILLLTTLTGTLGYYILFYTLLTICEIGAIMIKGTVSVK